MVAAQVNRIVFSSTCAIFGPPEHVPINETAPARPINPYGESKLAFEKILRWYDQIHGLKFVSLRYFNAAGASGKFGEDHRLETHLIPNVLKVALGQKAHIEIFGADYETPDGTCIRDYIHIVDLARAYSRSERSEEPILQSWHWRRLKRSRSDRRLSQNYRPKH
jgi:UDP-glucose 4-epimerase